MKDVLPITYGEFWDVPRVFVASDDDRRYAFLCRFDDDMDDYPDAFQVYLTGPMSEEATAAFLRNPDVSAARHLGSVPVPAVQFDESRRKSIGSEVIRRLVAPAPALGRIGITPLPGKPATR